ncbi:hypothetical protein Tco_0546146 [Tanacetum coccineum]
MAMVVVYGGSMVVKWCLKSGCHEIEKKDRSSISLAKADYTSWFDCSGLERLFPCNEENLGEDASKQGKIDAIDADKEITLVSVHDVNVSAREEVSVAGDKVSTASAATTTTAIITTVDDITLAQALKEMKSTKPKKKGVVIQEIGESTTTISSQLSSQQSQEKGKGILIEAKIDADHQLAERMQAQEQEELSIEENATLFQ